MVKGGNKPTTDVGGLCTERLALGREWSSMMEMESASRMTNDRRTKMKTKVKENHQGQFHLGQQGLAGD